MQIAMVGTVGIRATLRQRERKDYAVLNAERMVYISFVINAFKKNCVLLMLKNTFLGFSRGALVLQMWSVLVFRSTNSWLPSLVVLVWMVGELSEFKPLGIL